MDTFATDPDLIRELEAQTRAPTPPADEGTYATDPDLIRELEAQSPAQPVPAPVEAPAPKPSGGRTAPLNVPLKAGEGRTPAGEPVHRHMLEEHLPTQPQEYTQEFSKAAAQSAVQTAGTTLEGLPGMIMTDPKAWAEVDAGLKNLRNMTGDQARAFVQSIPRRVGWASALNLQRAAAQYWKGEVKNIEESSHYQEAVKDLFAGDIKETAPYKLGKKLEESVSGPEFRARPEFEGGYTQGAGQAVGSSAIFALPFLGPLGRLGKASEAISGAAGIAASGGQQMQDIEQTRAEEASRASIEARRAGMGKPPTNEELIAATLGGAPVGTTEKVPLAALFERVPGFSKIPATWKGKIARGLARIGTQMAEEGGQEAFQGWYQNLIAKLEGYDPNRPLSKGVGWQAVLGALGGGIIATPVAVVDELSRKGEVAPQQPPAPQPPPEAVQPPAQGERVEPTLGPEPPPPPAAGPAPSQGPNIVAETLQKAGYSESDIATMTPDQVRTALTEAQAQGAVTNIPPVPESSPRPAPGTVPKAPGRAAPVETTSKTVQPPEIAPKTGEEPQASEPAKTPANITAPETEAGTKASTQTPEAASKPPEGATQVPDGTREAPVVPETEVDLEPARQQVEPEPTPGQREAENYRHGHARIHGLDISIETAKGGTRRGTNPDGTEWSVQMPADYGRIKRTEGADAEQMDVYIGPDPKSDRAFVVNQIDPETKKFDEHKIILGTRTLEEAEAIYEGGFSDGSGQRRMGQIEEMSVDELKGWMKEGDTTAPRADVSQNAVPGRAEEAPQAETPAEATPATPEEIATDEEAATSAKASQKLHIETLRDPGYKKFLKNQKEENAQPHRDSPVSYEQAQGYRDGKAGQPPNARFTEPSEGQQINPYLQGYWAATHDNEYRPIRNRNNALVMAELAEDTNKPETVSRLTKPAKPKTPQVEAMPGMTPLGARDPTVPWTPIGQNADGKPLFENKDGVRSYTENGVRTIEPVSMRPTRGGMALDVKRPAEPEFEPVAEPAKEAHIEEEGKTDADTSEIQPPPPRVPREEPAGGTVQDEGGREPAIVPPGDRGAGDGNARSPDHPDAQQPEPSEGLRGAGEEIAGGPAGGRRDRDERDNLAAARRQRTELNYRITPDDKIGQGGPKEKVRANIEAIRVLKDIEDARREATAEEKRKLVRYVGWGAFAQDVFAEHKPEWKNERDQLRSLLSSDEFDKARASTLNAHYTSADVITGMWSALEHLGFTGGRALEPSAGVGHFVGLIPNKLQPKTDWSLVELDSITGRIAKQLYAGADVNVQGFETFNRPDDFYDLAISNVPFGNFQLPDRNYPPLSIHDYFFVKALDKVRPGGLVTFITSSFSMDKAATRARKEIDKRADFLGAIRLPGGRKGAFAGNAGTEVTTDIIFLRKRGKGEAPSPQAKPWQALKSIETPEGETQINEYFADNPQMMLGVMRLTGTMYADKSPMLEGSTLEIDEKIAGAARIGLPENAFLPRRAPIEIEPETTEAEGQKVGAFFEKNGKLFQNIAGAGQLVTAPDTERTKIRDFMAVRDVVNELLGNQAKGVTEGNDALRKQLARTYNAFVKKHGPINLEKVTVTSRLNGKGENVVIRRLPNLSAFRSDPDAYKVAAIENYDSDTGKASKAAIFDADIIGAIPVPKVETAVDAIAVSLNMFGRIAPEQMASLLGTSEDAVIRELGEFIYQNPKGDEWETASNYLSGDVVTKLEEARAAVKVDNRYERNVEALLKVQPPPLTRDEISLTFGAAWTPKDVIETFVREEMEGDRFNLILNPITKSWIVGGTYYFPPEAQNKYGTPRASVGKLLEAALNSSPFRVVDRDRDGKDVVDQKATEEAQAKIKQIREAFSGDPDVGLQGWVWKDDERATRLEAIYNEQFNRLVSQTFDGSHLTMQGIASTIRTSGGDVVPFELRQHQKDSIWRIIQNGNTLLAHVVGAGKTFTMIGAGMELRRLGQIGRPMYVVPNHMLEQFSREFLQSYPGANILIAQREEMTRDNRRAFAAKIAAQKWDGIVITHDAFGRVSMSAEAYKEFIENEIDETVTAIEYMRSEEGKKGLTVKALEQRKKALLVKLAKLVAQERKDAGVTFEELGVDFLFVDEAHLFKNLSFFTRHTRVKGIGAGNAQRAMDLFLKTQHLEKLRPGKSVVFATGTPISNTMAEAYTMQRYLQLRTLKAYGVDKFDGWASTFGEVRTTMELSPDGRTFRESTSFSRFVNIPELVGIYSLIADTKTAEMLDLPRPKLAGDKINVVEAEPNDREEAYIQSLIKRAEEVRGKKAEKGGDNMLKVVSEGRKVATDGRLLSEDFAFNPDGKVAKAVKRIVDIYKAGKEPGLVQMVFLDMGVPFTERKAKAAPAPVIDEEGNEIEVDIDDSEALRARFNLYEDLRKRLVEAGIPRKEIAFIHEAGDDAKKAELFRKVRAAAVRVLIGSTGKMGMGTNVQSRLKAMHHLDAPWKPAEVEQRDGRMVRQGNLNDEVEMYRYVTKRSFDAFMWQTLERKAKFISQIQAGARGIRTAEDIDNPLPEAAELKAAAAGDPRIMEYAELSKKVRELDVARANHSRTISEARRQVNFKKDEIEKIEGRIAKISQDTTKVEDLSGDKFKVEVLGKTYTEREKAGEAIKKFLLEQAPKIWSDTRLKVGKMSGFDMIVSTRRTGRGDKTMVDGIALLEGAQKYQGFSDFGITDGLDPGGLVARFKNILDDVKPSLVDQEKALAQARITVTKLTEQGKNKPFPREGEWADTKKRLAELTKALSEANKPKAAEPVAPREPPLAEIKERTRAGMPALERGLPRPPTAAQRAKAVSDVQLLANQILGHTVEIVDYLRDEAGSIMAGFQGMTTGDLIQIAINLASNPKWILRHEAVHRMRFSGFFTKGEWDILSRAVRRFPLSPRRAAGYAAYYAKQGYSPSQVADILIEEQIADYLADQAEQPLPPIAQRIVDRMRRFLEALANLLRGHGFITAKGVAAKFESGEIGRRPERTGPTRDEMVGTFSPQGMPAMMPVSPGPATFQEPEDSVAAQWHNRNLGMFARVAGATQNAILPMRRAIQDSMVDWLRIEKALVAQFGMIPEWAKVYRTETLYAGRTGERLEDFQEDELRPLIAEMAERNITLDEIGDYLYARHAPERNAYIASINPTMPDGGSGMTDAEATQIMQDFAHAGKLTDLQTLASRVDAVLAATRQRLLNEGIIDQATFDNWSTFYQHYAPTRGWEVDPDEDAHLPRGRKFDTRTRVDQAALGRRSKADNPLLYIVAQAQQSIVLGEKARVGRAVLKMARGFPHSGLWEVDQVVSTRAINPTTGLVMNRRDGSKRTRADNVLAVRVGGNLYWVTLHHKGMRDGIKGSDGDQVIGIIRFLGTLQRYYALMLTGLNVEFFGPNFFRDLLTSTLHIGADQGKTILRQTLRDLPKAIKGSFLAERGNYSSTWAQHYRDFARAGGKVGTFGLVGDVNDIRRRAEAELKRSQHSAAAIPGNVLRAVVEFTLAVSGAIENGVRLSLYANLRRAGHSQDESAFVGKEVTVNFNRKGAWGKWINAIYIFFNAGVQGSTRIATGLARSRKLRIAVAGAVVWGFIQDWMNSMLSGDDDDDGTPDYDDLSEEQRQRNLIFMFPGQSEGIQIPLPWGYNVFFYAGQNASRVLRRQQTPLEGAANLASALMQAFNPIYSPSVSQMLSPTITDPYFQLKENENAFGQPIMPDKKQYDKEVKENQRYFSTVSPAAKWLTDQLAHLNGGNEIRPTIDVSPEAVEHIAEFLMGGVGKVITNASTILTQGMRGEEIPAEKIPIARRFYFKHTSYSGRDRFYKIVDSVEATKAEMAGARKAQDQAWANRVRKEHAADFKIEDILKDTQKDLKDLRKLRDRAKTPAERDAVIKRIDMKMARVRKRYKILLEAK